MNNGLYKKSNLCFKVILTVYSSKIKYNKQLGVAFGVGGLLPFLVTLFLLIKSMEYFLYGFALFFLIVLGVLSARAGSSSIGKAIIRITFWGTVAMGLTALVGYFFNVNGG